MTEFGSDDLTRLDRECLFALLRMQQGHIGGPVRSILDKQIQTTSSRDVYTALEKLSEFKLVEIKSFENGGFPAVAHMTQAGVAVCRKIEDENQIPAADRIVTLNHNSEAYKKAVSALDAAIEEIEGTNYYPEPNDKEDVLTDLREGRGLLKETQVSLKKIDDCVLRVLKYLEVRAIAVAKVVAAIYAIKILFGF